MATFSVDVGNIVFAGGRLGFKDVFITNGPSNGLLISLRGNDSTFFKVQKYTPSYYQISTKQHNETGSARTAYVRFINRDDSDDYVDVDLTQYSVTTMAMYGDGITNTGNNEYSVNVDNETGELDVYLDAASGDGVSAQVTSGSDWLSELSGTPAVTDTGFIYWIVTYISNFDPARTGQVQFSSSGGSLLTLTVEQDGDAPTSVLAVTPSSLSYSSAGGTRSITVDYRGDTYNCDTTAVSSWVSVSLSRIVTGVLSGTVTCAANTSTAQRSGNVVFSDISGSINLPITQDGTAITLAVSPSELDFPASGGTRTLAVSYANSLSTNSASMPDWLSESFVSVDASNRTYTVNASTNTSTSARSFNWTFQDSNMSLTVPVSQAAGSQSSLEVSPLSETIRNSATTVYVTVTGADPNTISYTISSNWISYNGRTGNVWAFDCAANSGSSSRTGRVTFSALGYESVVYTITQTNDSPDITVSPDKLYFNLGKPQPLQVTVTYPGSLTISKGSDMTVSLVQESGNQHIYNISMQLNTGSLYTEATSTSYVTFNGQYGGSTTLNTYGNYLSATPSSLTFSANSSYQDVTIYVLSNAYTLEERSMLSWVTQSTVSTTNNTIVKRIRVTENTTGSDRTGILHFRILPNGTSADMYNVKITITQSSGSTPETQTLSATPTSLRFYKESGRRYVKFNYIPTNGISNTITYTDGSGWLSITDAGNRKSIVASSNSGSRRRATIRFYETGNVLNYVDINVIQGSAYYYDSIWMDTLFYPQDRDADGNYYYRLIDQSSNAIYFEGISTQPTSWGGNVGGIDIPRLVDDNLYSYFDQTPGQWNKMYGYCTADLYNMTQTGYPGTIEETFKYWNDWSRTEKRYDYTRYINDPINFKGCDDMVIPICVYYDDEATLSIVETEINGTVNTYQLGTPEYPFVMRYDTYYNSKNLDFKQDNEVIFSYDMTHCGQGAFVYRNRFGGWDSFLIEGNISKKDNYKKQNYRKDGEYNQDVPINTLHYNDEKYTDNIDITTTFEAYTGWLTDDESERLVYHLLSSPIVYFQNLGVENYDTDPELLMPVSLTVSSVEYKKFRNGRRLVNYLITFEKCNIQKVRD